MTAEELFRAFQKEFGPVELPDVTTALERLVAEAQKPAYQRDTNAIHLSWQQVRRYGVEKQLFRRFEGNADARWCLGWFLDRNKPRKSSREKRRH